MIKTDTHIHSIHSSDAISTMEEIAQVAMQKKLATICLTDHIDVDYPNSIDFNRLDPHDYLRNIKEVQERYASLRILTGLEIGLQPHLQESTDQIVKRFDPDFVIGSIHCVFAEEISHHGLFKERNKIQAYERYFEAMLQSIQIINNYDSLGHLDFVERYYHSPDKLLYYADHREIIDEVLKHIIANDKAIELNTSGFRYKLGQAHPSNEILIRYRELGGYLITIGSDAHRAIDVGADFNLAEDILHMCGFKEYYYYEKRKPVGIML